MSRDSSVGIATRYGLVSPGIESRWGRDFPHPSRPAVGPTQPPIQWVPDLFRGVKRPGRGADHPPPSSAEVKKRVELYLYSPSGPSWPVTGWTLPLPLPLPLPKTRQTANNTTLTATPSNVNVYVSRKGTPRKDTQMLTLRSPLIMTPAWPLVPWCRGSFKGCGCR